VMDRFGTEALRFYLLRDVTFGADGTTSMAAVQARYEAELANELGNLASRTIAMIGRYRDGAVPAAEPDPAVAAEFEALPARVGDLMDRAEVTQALEEIWQRVRRLNRFVEEQAPWQLAKDDSRSADLDRALRTLAEGLRIIAVLLWPWLPTSMEKLLDALGAPDRSLDDLRLDAGRVERVTALDPLFPKHAQPAAGL
jgi:methionyl-tRNA synthetase